MEIMANLRFLLKKLHFRKNYQVRNALNFPGLAFFGFARKANFLGVRLWQLLAYEQATSALTLRNSHNARFCSLAAPIENPRWELPYNLKEQLAIYKEKESK